MEKHYFCSAKNCFNSRKTARHLCFFAFPKDEDRCKKWVEAASRLDLLSSRSAEDVHRSRYLLCSEHFEPNSYLSPKKNRLLRNAIPTIFPDVPQGSSLKTEVRKAEESAAAETDSKALAIMKKSKRNYDKCVSCRAVRKPNSCRKYFTFPKDPERCQKWVEACNLRHLHHKSPEYLHKRLRLCSAHFSRSDYASTKFHHLHSNAVPSIFPARDQIDLSSLKRSLGKKLNSGGEEIVPSVPDLPQCAPDAPALEKQTVSANSTECPAQEQASLENSLEPKGSYDKDDLSDLGDDTVGDDSFDFTSAEEDETLGDISSQHVPETLTPTNNGKVDECPPATVPTSSKESLDDRNKHPVIDAALRFLKSSPEFRTLRYHVEENAEGSYLYIFSVRFDRQLTGMPQVSISIDKNGTCYLNRPFLETVKLEIPKDEPEQSVLELLHEAVQPVAFCQGIPKELLESDSLDVEKHSVKCSIWHNIQYSTPLRHFVCSHCRRVTGSLQKKFNKSMLTFDTSKKC